MGRLRVRGRKTGLVGMRGSTKAFKAERTASQTPADPPLPTRSSRLGLENRLPEHNLPKAGEEAVEG